jgi:hypothetical protein
MHQQISHSHFAGHIRVRHLERRQIVDNAIGPMDFAFIDQHRQRRRGKRFGIRCDPKQSIRGYRRGVAQFSYAEPFGEDHLTVLYDGHGDTGNVECLAAFSTTASIDSCARAAAASRRKRPLAEGKGEIA